jgi:molybdenum cofactor cytidylyltransferase
VILAAGASRRMGSAKQLLTFRGKTLIRHAAEIAIASGFTTILVTGSGDELVKKQMKRLEVSIVKNEQWEEGIASSIRCGVNFVRENIEKADGIIFMVCDQPFAGHELLINLIEKQKESAAPLVASNYAGINGVPALFHKSLFNSLLKLKGDSGARKLLQEYAGKVAIVPFPLGEIDIDTRKDYDNLPC